jgi:hypothetical protein
MQKGFAGYPVAPMEIAPIHFEACGHAYGAVRHCGRARRTETDSPKLSPEYIATGRY